MSPILFFDTETTGLPDWKSPSESEHQPHLVQIGAVLADADTRKVISTLDVIIRPDGWEIPAEVSDIHGITHAHAMHVGVSEATAVELLFQLWRGHPRVAHNRTFDQRIIRIAAKRHLGEEAAESWAEKDAFDDTMLMAKPIMQLPPKGRYGWKSPKLAEAYEHFTGRKLEGAHTALADAQACMEIYWAMQPTEEAA